MIASLLGLGVGALLAYVAGSGWVEKGSVPPDITSVAVVVSGVVLCWLSIRQVLFAFGRLLSRRGPTPREGHRRPKTARMHMDVRVVEVLLVAGGVCGVLVQLRTGYSHLPFSQTAQGPGPWTWLWALVGVICVVIVVVWVIDRFSRKTRWAIARDHWLWKAGPSVLVALGDIAGIDGTAPKGSSRGAHRAFGMVMGHPMGIPLSLALMGSVALVNHLTKKEFNRKEPDERIQRLINAEVRLADMQLEYDNLMGATGPKALGRRGQRELLWTLELAAETRSRLIELQEPKHL